MHGKMIVWDTVMEFFETYVAMAFFCHGGGAKILLKPPPLEKADENGMPLRSFAADSGSKTVWPG